LLRLLVGENCIRLNSDDDPEFDQWLWVDYWYPLAEVVYFKKEVYENALRELQSLLLRSKKPQKRRLTYKLPLSKGVGMQL